MIRFTSAILLAALAASPARAADGAQLFATQCKLCHQAASSPLGPTLAGVAGRNIGGRTDFNYSPALKAKGGSWTAQNMDAWLKAPTAFAPGTKMITNVPSAESRAAIIGYLKTLK